MFTGEMIRDVGRALPWLASEPPPEPVPANVPLRERTELLDALAKNLRIRYDKLYPVIDRGGKTLAAAFEEQDPASIADPEGEGVEALEKAETYFKGQRSKLGQLREALVEIGAPSDHNVFRALDRLDGLHMWIVATMQEVRWTVLIADGGKLPPSDRSFKSGAALVAALGK